MNEPVSDRIHLKHSLTHEVAYGSLLKDRKCALHEKIVEAIERLYPDRLTEQIEPPIMPSAPRPGRRHPNIFVRLGLKSSPRGVREVISYFVKG
jgi:hypothetical protein